MTTLDERTGRLLAGLVSLCTGGGYHIVEEADLMPYAREGVGEMLSFLADSRLLEVRYAENGTYCLRLLPAGRAYAQCARERARAEVRRLRMAALLTFIGAMLGGAVGALLAAVCLVGG